MNETLYEIPIEAIAFAVGKMDMRFTMELSAIMVVLYAAVKQPGVHNMLLKIQNTNIYSFFFRENNDKADKLMAKAFDEFSALVTEMSDETREGVIAIAKKQSENYDPDLINFIQELRIDISNYPELPNGAVTVAEIEQAIQARKEHHAKIMLAINHYLSPSCENDDERQSYNTFKEI